MLKLSTQGMNHIKKWEGLRLQAYRCPAGVWTIGYGHTGPDVKPKLVITEEKAYDLLDKDTDIAENAVNQNVKVRVTQIQFDALVSFVFNVGVGAFKASTLLRMLNQGKFNQVPTQMKRWVYDGNGKAIPGLVRRRKEEAEMWLDDIKPSATPFKPPKK